MRRRAFTLLDGVLLAALLALNGFLWARGAGGTPSALEVLSEGGTRTEPLEGPRELEVAGPLGTTLVRIDAEGARVVDSPCPLKLCVAAGKVSRPGQVVACLPNRVALRVLGTRDGRGEEGVDAVGR